MTMLLTADVVPLYAQIVAFDEHDPDGLPEAESGDEQVVAGFSGLTVATRSDWVASEATVFPVRVEVWEGSGPTDAGDLHVAWRGEITVGSGGLTVGSLVGADLHRVATRPGRRAIVVLTAPAVEPDRVVVVLD